MVEVEDIFEIYQDVDDKWRWTRVAPTGEITDTSGESFDTRRECEENAKRFGYWEEF